MERDSNPEPRASEKDALSSPTPYSETTCYAFIIYFMKALFFKHKPTKELHKKYLLSPEQSLQSTGSVNNSRPLAPKHYHKFPITYPSSQLPKDHLTISQVHFHKVSFKKPRVYIYLIVEQPHKIRHHACAQGSERLSHKVRFRLFLRIINLRIILVSNFT